MANGEWGVMCGARKPSPMTAWERVAPAWPLAMRRHPLPQAGADLRVAFGIMPSLATQYSPFAPHPFRVAAQNTSAEALIAAPSSETPVQPAAA